MRPSRRSVLAAALALGACGRRAAEAATPDPPLKAVAGFPVGTCVMTPELADPAFVSLLTRQFSQVTPEWELKMERVVKDDGSFDFSAADAIAEVCRRGGLALHATTLVWYAQDPAPFRRMIGDRKAFELGYRNYIAAAAGRYRGLARGWDVLNEAVAEDGNGYRGGIWEQALGPDYGRLAFEIAREADPSAVLFLNDYNLETMPAKLDSFQRLLEQLLKSGAPVTGIGTQTHLNADLPPGQAARAIQALARFGLPIHVSELDISTRGGGFAPASERLARQARVAGEVAEAFMALPTAQRYAFTVWGVRDQDSWLRKPPNAGDGHDQPLLFDDAGAPKPAFEAVRRAFART